MILPLLSMILAGVCVPTSYGCPDYESQRAAEIDDSLTYIQDSLDAAELAEGMCNNHSLNMPSAPLLVVLTSRNTATEPERATTCYIDLDCPEDRN